GAGRTTCGPPPAGSRKRTASTPPHGQPTARPRESQAGLESLEEVQKLLNKLPSREREVVRLCYLEGRSYEEISLFVLSIAQQDCGNFTGNGQGIPASRSAYLRRLPGSLLFRHGSCAVATGWVA